MIRLDGPRSAALSRVTPPVTIPAASVMTSRERIPRCRSRSRRWRCRGPRVVSGGMIQRTGALRDFPLKGKGTTRELRLAPRSRRDQHAGASCGVVA